MSFQLSLNCNSSFYLVGVPCKLFLKGRAIRAVFTGFIAWQWCWRSQCIKKGGTHHSLSLPCLLSRESTVAISCIPWLKVSPTTSLLLTSSRLEKAYVKAVVRKKSRTRERVRDHDLTFIGFSSYSSIRLDDMVSAFPSCRELQCFYLFPYMHTPCPRNPIYCSTPASLPSP